MPRIDFYVLPENANTERFACAMIGKAWSKGNQVYVHSASRTDAIRFDDLLWIFNDISFLPHALLEEDGQDEAPIVIGWQHRLREISLADDRAGRRPPTRCGRCPHTD